MRNCLDFRMIRESYRDESMPRLALREDAGEFDSRFYLTPHAGTLFAFDLVSAANLLPREPTAPVPKHGRATRREAPHPRSTKVARPFSIRRQFQPARWPVGSLLAICRVHIPQRSCRSKNGPPWRHSGWPFEARLHDSDIPERPAPAFLCRTRSRQLRNTDHESATGRESIETGRAPGGRNGPRRAPRTLFEDGRHSRNIFWAHSWR